MKNRLINRLEMYHVLGIFLDGGKQKLEKIPAYPGARETFDGFVEKIESAAGFQLTRGNGKTAIKTEAVNKLYTLADAVRDMLYAYAVKSGNAELTDVARKFRSETHGLRGSERILRIAAFVQRAAEVREHLAHYSEVDTLTLLEKAVQEATSARQDKEHAAFTQKMTGMEIESLFIDTDKLIRVEFGAIMAPFKSSDPAFYAAFTAAKEVKNLGARHEKKDQDAAPSEGAPAKDATDSAKQPAVPPPPATEQIPPEAPVPAAPKPAGQTVIAEQPVPLSQPAAPPANGVSHSD